MRFTPFIALLLLTLTSTVHGQGQVQLAPLTPIETATPARLVISAGFAPGCVISAVDKSTVPAEEAGVLKQIMIPVLDAQGVQVQQAGQPFFQRTKAGLHVKQGQILAYIDDKLAAVNLDVAKDKLKVAEKEAGNDVNIRHARAARDVAQATVQQAEQANQKVPGTVPYIEMLRYKLEAIKSELQIEQAEHDLAIAETSVDVRKSELRAAEEQLERRTIRAPFDGIITDVTPHLGEWLEPGSPVLTLVRVDKLYVEGYQSRNQIEPSALEGQPVTIRVKYANNQTRDFPGMIDFVSPEDLMGQQFRIRAEVPNELSPNGSQWMLRPGMNADLSIPAIMNRQ